MLVLLLISISAVCCYLIKKMGSKIEYVDSSHMYATNYVRNSKAIGVLWAVFTICYAIIVIVAFVTPEWVGDWDSEYPGRFGLWSSCQADDDGEHCNGRLDEIGNIPSTAFQIATILVGVSCFVALLTICCMLFFIFCQSTTVFHVCGWMQLISAVTLIAGVCLYPAGWDAPEVRRTCGADAGRFSLGRCGLRWAYHLAAIGCFDAVVLAILAFILATRHIKLQAEPMYGVALPNGSLYKGEVNSAFVTDGHSIAGGSRKSLNLHPVLLMHPPGTLTRPHGDDTYSQFSSRTARSKHSAYQPEYNTGMHNFHL